jgi:hypothetical protein
VFFLTDSHTHTQTFCFRLWVFNLQLSISIAIAISVFSFSFYYLFWFFLLFIDIAYSSTHRYRYDIWLRYAGAMQDTGRFYQPVHTPDFLSLFVFDLVIILTAIYDLWIYGVTNFICLYLDVPICICIRCILILICCNCYCYSVSVYGAYDILVYVCLFGVNKFRTFCPSNVKCKCKC